MPEFRLQEPPRRYKVVEGSVTSHCCFMYTVLDTHRPEARYSPERNFHVMCECFDREEAYSICSALNGVHHGR